ncbi:unnamed protein product, partial [Polarella glacialis]
ESITFDVPLHLADRVLGNGSWARSVQERTGARVVVRRDATRCQLELCGQPEQVVEAETMAEEAVRNAGSSASSAQPLLERLTAAAGLSAPSADSRPSWSSSAPAWS